MDISVNEFVPASKRLSEMINNSNHQPLTIKDILLATRKQGLGLLFIVFALPVLVPLPPGLGAIPGLLLLIFGLQGTMGNSAPRIPKRIENFNVRASIVNLIEIKAVPIIAKLEKSCGIPTEGFELSKIESRITSLIVVLMSLLVMLPTPFLNTIPAFITVMVGLSFICGNRKLLWVGAFLGLLTFALIGSTIAIGTERLIDEINELL